MAIPRWLQHPLTRGMDLDDPATTEARREIVRSKPFLRRIYLEWYGLIRASLPSGPGAVLEIGSGAGFLREIVPEAIASEVFPCSGVQLVLDARDLPFADNSLRAIAMVDVPPPARLPSLLLGRGALREAGWSPRRGGTMGELLVPVGVPPAAP